MDNNEDSPATSASLVSSESNFEIGDYGFDPEGFENFAENEAQFEDKLAKPDSEPKHTGLFDEFSQFLMSRADAEAIESSASDASLANPAMEDHDTDTETTPETEAKALEENEIQESPSRARFIAEITEEYAELRRRSRQMLFSPSDVNIQNVVNAVNVEETISSEGPLELDEEVSKKPIGIRRILKKAFYKAALACGFIGLGIWAFIFSQAIIIETKPWRKYTVRKLNGKIPELVMDGWKECLDCEETLQHGFRMISPKFPFVMFPIPTWTEYIKEMLLDFWSMIVGY